MPDQNTVHITWIIDFSLDPGLGIDHPLGIGIGDRGQCSVDEIVSLFVDGQEIAKQGVFNQYWLVGTLAGIDLNLAIAEVYKILLLNPVQEMNKSG